MANDDRRERPVITQEMINLFDDYTHLSLDRRSSWTIWPSWQDLSPPPPPPRR